MDDRQISIRFLYIGSCTYVSSDDRSEAMVDSSATSAMETACCSICLRDTGVLGFSGVSGGATSLRCCIIVRHQYVKS